MNIIKTLSIALLLTVTVVSCKHTKRDHVHPHVNEEVSVNTGVNKELDQDLIDIKELESIGYNSDVDTSPVVIKMPGSTDKKHSWIK